MWGDSGRIVPTHLERFRRQKHRNNVRRWDYRRCHVWGNCLYLQVTDKHKSNSIFSFCSRPQFVLRLVELLENHQLQDTSSVRRDPLISPAVWAAHWQRSRSQQSIWGLNLQNIKWEYFIRWWFYWSLFEISTSELHLRIVVFFPTCILNLTNSLFCPEHLRDPKDHFTTCIHLKV